ncbi:MAG: peptidase [Gemmatimonadota bacterium]|nr:peptidase [Gemmatimonadota bacterium]
MPAVLFVFLDGVGIGIPDPERNPFFAGPLPTLERYLGGVPSLDEPALDGSGGVSFPLEATLGVEGLPQSGTGQYALLTGDNGSRRIGRHFGPWTPTALRSSLLESNLLTRTQSAGHAVTFANAHPPGYRGSRWYRRPAPIPMAADHAGLMTRGIQDVAEGAGLASDLDNARMQTVVDEPLPVITPAESGANLARIADGHALTLFAHYGTDVAGHRGSAAEAQRALKRVDDFLGGILATRSPGQGVLVASDHGNIESVEAGHTRNPALGIWFPPPSAANTAGDRPLPESLLDVAEWVGAYLDGAPPT